MNPFKPKKDESPPRILYAMLHFAEAPFEDGHSQKKCTFSFRVIDSAGAFPFSDLNLTQEGTAFHNRYAGQLHFQIVVSPYPNYDYVYTGIVQITASKRASILGGVELTNENRWLRTINIDLQTVSKGITRMFVGHPKLHRFLFAAEQKR